MDFKELGQAIMMMRKEKTISQKELSKALEISRATISNLENGSGVDVGVRKVMRIVDFLGFELSLKEKSKFPVFEELLGE